MVALYPATKEMNLSQNSPRWSGDTRNWTPIGTVALNPERRYRRRAV